MIDTSLVCITRPSFCRPHICFCSRRLCSCSCPIFSMSWQMCSRYPRPEPSGLDWLAWFTWLSRQNRDKINLSFHDKAKKGDCKHSHWTLGLHPWGKTPHPSLDNRLVLNKGITGDVYVHHRGLSKFCGTSQQEQCELHPIVWKAMAHLTR